MFRKAAAALVTCWTTLKELLVFSVASDSSASKPIEPPPPPPGVCRPPPPDFSLLPVTLLYKATDFRDTASVMLAKRLELLAARAKPEMGTASSSPSFTSPASELPSTTCTLGASPSSAAGSPLLLQHCEHAGIPKREAHKPPPSAPRPMPRMGSNGKAETFESVSDGSLSTSELDRVRSSLMASDAVMRRTAPPAHPARASAASWAPSN
mmetsp:Transcript_22089/g.63238  ORF Transcript_22089/g.63238 Transcript_22089/m.63238 type:complete len:210 (+) Transcript_22089:1991-2620(+)